MSVGQNGRDVPKGKLQHLPARREQTKSVSGPKSPDKKSRTQSKSIQYNHSNKKEIASEFNLIFCNKILARKNIILVKTIRADLCRTPYYVAQFTIKRDSKFYGLCLRRQ